MHIFPEKSAKAVDEVDMEKHDEKDMAIALSDSLSERFDPHQDHELPAIYRAYRDSAVLAKLRSWEAYMDKKFGVESRGPTRILPEEKDPAYGHWRQQITMCLLWASGTMNLSCFATGLLGPEFGLSLGQSIAITMFGTLLGASVTGWLATMGPEMGLREVSIARYSWGWWPSKIMAVANVVINVGWCAVGCITGGQALAAVSDGSLDLALGVVIVCICGIVFSFIGLRAVLFYEKFAWMLFFIIFMIMYGMAAPKADLSWGPSVSGLSGSDESGAILVLLSICYGSSASWGTIVSDYYAHYPVNTSKVRVFALTTIGISVPTCIGMLLGCCVGSTVMVNDDWSAANDQGLGYLIQTMLYPIGFAKFILVLMVLSVIGMFCISVYSVALSIQQFARPLAIMPRFVWTIVIFGAVLVMALAGKDSLMAWLESFLSLLGYISTAFFVIVITEHYAFRDGWHAGCSNYDLTAWNNPAKLPLGIAAFLSFGAAVAGAVVGMSEAWYVGPLAKHIGTYFYGDIGNELAFAFGLLMFLPARYLERKWVGR